MHEHVGGDVGIKLGGPLRRLVSRISTELVAAIQTSALTRCFGCKLKPDFSGLRRTRASSASALNEPPSGLVLRMLPSDRGFTVYRFSTLAAGWKQIST